MKNIKSIDGKIHIIEDFISPDTAMFIYKAINPHVDMSHQKAGPSVFSGPSAGDNAEEVGIKRPIAHYNNDPMYNVGIDLLSLICPMMSRVISDFYKEDYDLKTAFYSKMVTGGRNVLHMDNRFVSTKDELLERPGADSDRSGLLYFYSDCEGGELNFPFQNFKIKPKPGTFIFFTGDEEVPHEVTPVLSGERNNLISFFWPAVRNSDEFYKTQRYTNARNGIHQEVQTTLEFLENHKNK
jgi:hypothetical protein